MNDNFILTCSNEEAYRELLGGGVTMARVYRNPVLGIFYVSPKPEFKKDVDSILAGILAKEAIAREENTARFNAESKAREDQRAIAAERALAMGIGR